jgi:hypothetical protein
LVRGMPWEKHIQKIKIRKAEQDLDQEGSVSDMTIIDGGVSSILSFSSCNFVCVKVSALVNKMLKLFTISTLSFSFSTRWNYEKNWEDKSEKDYQR